MFDFLTVGKTLKTFASELSSVRVEIETITREIEDIRYAPADTNDIVQALEIWAEKNENTYRNYLKSVFSRLFEKPDILSDPTEVWRSFHSREIIPEASSHTPISRDMQLCGLLGKERFVALMKSQIESMDWPESGLPIAKRPAAIALLERKIKSLQAREAELIRSAEKAGLHIS